MLKRDQNKWMNLFELFFMSNCSYDVGATTDTNLCHVAHTSGSEMSLRWPGRASERGTPTPSNLPETHPSSTLSHYSSINATLEKMNTFMHVLTV